MHILFAILPGWFVRHYARWYLWEGEEAIKIWGEMLQIWDYYCYIVSLALKRK